MDIFIVTLVILISAILVFFSQEFVAGFKKILAIPGMKLLLPLTLATILIVYYEAWVVWSLLKAKNALTSSTNALAGSLPFQQNAYLLANILILFCLPLLPLMARFFWLRKKINRNFRAYYLFVGILWLLVLILLLMDVHSLHA